MLCPIWGFRCPGCDRTNELLTSPIATVRDVGIISLGGGWQLSVEPDDALGTRISILPSMLLSCAGFGSSGAAPRGPTLAADGPTPVMAFGSLPPPLATRSSTPPVKSPTKRKSSTSRISPRRRNSKISPLLQPPVKQPATLVDIADQSSKPLETTGVRAAATSSTQGKLEKNNRGSSRGRIAPSPPTDMPSLRRATAPSFSTWKWGGFDAKHKADLGNLIAEREFKPTLDTFETADFGVDTMWHCTRCDNDWLKTQLGDNGEKCPKCGLNSGSKNLALPLISRDPLEDPGRQTGTTR